MKKLAIWRVTKGALARLDEATVELERNLEAWVSEDPDLLQNGLAIVGRQIPVESGFLDLLGLDPQGRWVVIELKRGDLDRKTIAQVQDYAACVTHMTEGELRAKTASYLAERKLSLDKLLEQRSAIHALKPEGREIVLMVVGTGKAPGLERLVGYLAGKLPMSILLFHVFKLPTGELLLAREVAEQEIEPTTQKASASSVDATMALAKRHGIDSALQHAINIANALGLHVRPYKTSLMFTPPSNATRMLFTVWAKPEKGKIKAYVGIEPFVEFFTLRRATVEKRLGAEGWRTFSPTSFAQFLRAVRSLLSTEKPQ
jgi:hypothetical protein